MALGRNRAANLTLNTTGVIWGRRREEIHHTCRRWVEWVCVCVSVRSGFGEGMWDLFDESSTWGTDKDDGAAVGGMFGDQGSVSWHQRALCAQTDPEAFFPEKGGSVHEAKMVCA